VPAPPQDCDLAVVGAGIVGLAVAREMALRHDGLRVVVLEREPRIAAHQTSHSSGVIHAGVYYRPGSLKARLCVEGARELYAYCDERAIPARRNGKLIVATRERELARLDELERRARANGVAGLRRVDAAEIREIEPHVSAIAGLHSPETGVVDFSRVAAAYAEDLVARGGGVVTGHAVLAISDGPGEVTIRHSGGSMRAGAAAVCAGAWADRLARDAGVATEPRTIPFRGAYLLLRPERSELVRGSVYPVPDPELPFLGAHLTRGVDGCVLLGPSALMAGAHDAYRLTRLSARELRDTATWPGSWRLARRHWRSAAAELSHAISKRAFAAAARRLVPELRSRDFVAGPAGVRGQAVARDGSLVDDFVVSQSERVLYVRNAPSPAATASLPLARLIADRLEPLLG
jgi:2-hydroxyglutarate dehydrogenase